MITKGSFNCLGLHKRGLYAAGTDGTIRLLDISGSKVREMDRNHISTSISMMTFNHSHDQLAIGSPAVNNCCKNYFKLKLVVD